MIEYYTEAIEVFKHNIRRRLETIGFLVNELLHSQTAKTNIELYKFLTAIISKVFKTYVSTQKLDYYFEPSIVKLSDVYYSDFKGYETGIFAIIFFVRKLKNYGFGNSDYKKMYFKLKDEIGYLNMDFKKVKREYNQFIESMELIKG